MPAPEVESLPQWLQYALGGLAFFGMAGSMVMRFLNGWKGDPEAGRHVIVEQGELADLSVIRAIIPKLDDALIGMQRVADLEDGQARVEERQKRVLEILERMDRQEEMRRIMREQAAEERAGQRPRG